MQKPYQLQTISVGLVFAATEWEKRFTGCEKTAASTKKPDVSNKWFSRKCKIAEKTNGGENIFVIWALITNSVNDTFRYPVSAGLSPLVKKSLYNCVQIEIF